MPYRSPEWVRRTGRERTIEALDQLSGNRRVSVTVSRRDYLEAMDERLEDAMDVTDNYTPEELAAISAVRSIITSFPDLFSENPGSEAVAALEAAAERAFSVTAGGNPLTAD